MPSHPLCTVWCCSFPPPGCAASRRPSGRAFSAVGRKYGRLLVTLLCGAVIVLPITALYLWFYFGMLNTSFAGMMGGNYASIGQMMSIMPLMSLVNIVFDVIVMLLGIATHYSLCVVINENRYAFTAVFDGFRLLFKGNFWKNIGNYVVMMLALMGAVIVFAIVMMLLSIPMMFASMVMPVLAVLMVLLILAFAGSIGPFQTTFIQLMYFNARLKTEGSMFPREETEA